MTDLPTLLDRVKGAGLGIACIIGGSLAGFVFGVALYALFGWRSAPANQAGFWAAAALYGLRPHLSALLQQERETK